MTRLVLALLVSVALLSPSLARAQPARCLPPDFLIAKARAERPSTEILAHHTGPEAAALVEAMSTLGADVDEEMIADEVTVLRSAGGEDVLLIGAEEGCLIWRGQLSLTEYQHALW